MKPHSTILSFILYLYLSCDNFLAGRLAVIIDGYGEPLQVGEGLFLTCRSNRGQMAMDYRWTFTPLGGNYDEDHIEVAHSSTYSVENVTEADAGLYKCEGNSASDTAEDTVTVAVRKPEVKKQNAQKRLDKIEGDNNNAVIYGAVGGGLGLVALVGMLAALRKKKSDSGNNKVCIGSNKSGESLDMMEDNVSNITAVG